MRVGAGRSDGAGGWPRHRYIGLSGALHAIGRNGESVPPLNLVGDFGGGGCPRLRHGALLEATRSGKGQADAAMVDGAASSWRCSSPLPPRGGLPINVEPICSTAAHFYDTYETADGEHVCIGSIEPQFYALLVEKAGLDPETFAPQMDRAAWPDLKARLAEVFKTKTRDEWREIMEGTDVCFAPVLSIFEAPEHPHNKARSTFVEVDGIMQPAPSPRFSRTEASIRGAAPAAGADSAGVLADFGYSADEIEELTAAGAVSGSEAA